VPYGSFFLRLDALSGFFLLPVFAICPLAAIYGAGYLEAFRPKKSLAPPWFLFNLLAASMAMVIVARNGLLFLAAWEMMALSSLFLVTFEDEKEEVRRAGWIYLVASHAGTAFLFALFILLGRAHGSLDFDRFDASAGTGLLFALALIGFGTKAGFVPLHVWLPQAHPAAPSHVSAVMSAVMINTGIYGLLRVFTLIGPLPAWCGWLLCVVGILSALTGALHALAQRDLKRLLAYSSVENAGIIALGIGVGLIGIASKSPLVACAGFAGGLLHLLNHSLFKSLLFLTAGAVVHGSHTRDLDRLGGLLKRMPVTGVLFAVGAVAVSALPPLNGLIGEFLVYLASLRGIAEFDGGGLTVLVSAFAALAAAGGFAAVAFAKAFGIAFLGHPRSESAEHARDPGWTMLAPATVLAAACALAGSFGARLVAAIAPLIASITGMPDAKSYLSGAANAVAHVAFVGGALAGISLVVMAARSRLLAGRKVRSALTWDCGYYRPAPRMQYTGSSFVQPLTAAFAAVLGTRIRVIEPRGLFPSDASLTTEARDPYQDRLFASLFGAIGRGLSMLRPLQQGLVQLYVLYIAITLIALLLWQFA